LRAALQNGAHSFDLLHVLRGLDRKLMLTFPIRQWFTHFSDEALAGFDLLSPGSQWHRRA
jgi:hypothetical protein